MTISFQPSQPPPDTPHTSSTDGQDNTSLLPHERLKSFFLGVPILSILVGGAVLIAEVVIIILVLAVPETVGLAEDVALTRAQRGVLGGVSIVMLIEAVIFGVIDIGIHSTPSCAFQLYIHQIPAFHIYTYMYMYMYMS